jgi:CRP-like cAMP-binding protein
VSTGLLVSETLTHVLREEPDLASAVSPGERERAIEECIAPVGHVRRGRWSGEHVELFRGGIGLLVLQGLLVRRVGVDGRFGAELLGEGDIVRPWQGEDAEPTLPYTTGWRVIEELRVALLDERAARRLAHYPELTGRLVGRALERSRNLAINMAIHHQARVDVRLHMLFWHLADRWGRVRPDGIVVPLRLTHAILADLVAARRPTVTGALARLTGEQLVTATGHGWLLSGEPPSELLELQDLALDRRPGRSTQAALESPEASKSV